VIQLASIQAAGTCLQTWLGVAHVASMYDSAMIDSVRFATTGQVVAYVEQSLSEAAMTTWQWQREEERGLLLAWTVFRAGKPAEHADTFQLLVDPAGEMFTWIHSNSTAGIFSRNHCLRNATVIHRPVFGMTIEDGPATLAGLLRHLLATTRPNEDWPT
jgi:hypothetical protein